MNAEKTKQLTDAALQALAAAIDAGHTPTLNCFLSAMARFHRYSFGNIMLIAFQRPDATRVAGFRTWQKLGRHVKRGEKGIKIIAPAARRKRDDAEDAREQPEVPYFLTAHVFDVAQTEGEPLPTLTEVTGDPADYLRLLRENIQGRGIDLQYSAPPSGAVGVSLGGRILIEPGLEPAAEFEVLAHELAHEILHQDDRRQRTTITVRELEAEAVACVVCEAIGLTARDAASEYIQLHHGDKDGLAESLGIIAQTATSIITAITRERDADAA
ncbi:MAG: ArdC family protein [Tepidisphaeraceae bacterium]|jgi:hypothetical protein